jgi:hypothetical protein
MPGSRRYYNAADLATGRDSDATFADRALNHGGPKPVIVQRKPEWRAARDRGVVSKLDCQ